MKLKWTVGEKPTGPYKSFANRSWPTAEYPDGDFAGSIAAVNGESYSPRIAETTELEVRVALRETDRGWNAGRLKKRVVGVKAAKALLQDFIDRNVERCAPISLRTL